MTIDVVVAGMSCGHCEQTVREAVERVSGVESAKASHADGRVTIETDAEVDLEAVRTAIRDAGYEPS